MKIFLAALLVLFSYGYSIAETFEVRMKEYKYEPETIVIKPGDTVRWLNKGENPHTTTSGADGKPDGAWRSERLQTGKAFEHTFSSAGVFPYFCEPHFVFGMKGVVEVKE